MSRAPANAVWRAGAVWSALGVAVLVYWLVRIDARASQVIGFEASDLFMQWVPAHAYIATRLRAGELALWNPWHALGHPFLATLFPAVLYPSRLLLLVLDAPTALHVTIVLHLAVALLATSALCRRLGADGPSALVGGLTFVGAFGLPIMYWSAHLEGGTWLPVAGLALVRMAETGRWRWALLLGLSAGMPVVAGCYQHALYAVYGLGVLGLALLADPRRRGFLASRAGGLRLAVAGLLALATAAPQLVPTLLWSANAVRRVTALSDTQIDPYSNPAQTLHAVLFPAHGFSPIYLSLPVLALAVVGFTTQRAFGAVLGSGALLFFMLLLGRGTSFFGLYRLLPGFAVFRLPDRLAILVAFLAGIGAALGARRLARAGAPGPAPYLGPLVALAVVIWALHVPARFSSALPWTAAAESLRGPTALFEPLARLTGPGRTVLPGNAYPDGIGVRDAAAWGVAGLMDYNPLTSRLLTAYVHAIFGKPPPAADELVPFQQGFVPLNWPIVRPALLDAVAVRTLVLPSGAVPPTRSPPFEAVTTVGRWRLYRNPQALPRAFTLAHVRVVPDDDAALAALGAPDFDPHREVVLTGADNAAPIADGRAVAEAASIVVDEPEHVVVDVAVDRPSVLVLTDALAPGWSATLDGRPTRVWPANYLVRGVIVGPGDRRVEFTYRTPGLVLGLAAAAAAWTVTLGVLLARLATASGAQKNCAKRSFPANPAMASPDSRHC